MPMARFFALWEQLVMLVLPVMDDINLLSFEFYCPLVSGCPFHLTFCTLTDAVYLIWPVCNQVGVKGQGSGLGSTA